jgi:hypothetical protein
MLDSPCPNAFDSLLGPLVVSGIEMTPDATLDVLNDGTDNCCLVVVAQLGKPLCENAS